MILSWHQSTYPLKFGLGDFTLGSWRLRLKACEVGLAGPDSDFTEGFAEKPGDGYDGFMVRGLPTNSREHIASPPEPMIQYELLVYQRYWLNFAQSYEEYLQGMSGKTRSGARRKVKKFTQYCDDKLDYRIYQHPDEMIEFHRLAGEVSGLTYQERLLNAGIPADHTFKKKMLEAAANGQIRGFLLFCQEKPVSYLYLTGHDRTLYYSYLGYDPDYSKQSVGLVLHWLAVESLFAEQAFDELDFTDGEGQLKQSLGTSSTECVNLLLLKPKLTNRIAMALHRTVGNASTWIGKALDKMGVKARIKKIIRSTG